MQKSLVYSLNYISLLKYLSTLLIGQAGGQLLALVRNAIIGHQLSPYHFGIAASFTITVALVEMMSEMGVDKYLIRSTEHDIDKLQQNAHFLSLLRGLLGGLVLFIISPLAAKWFNVSEAISCFYMLSAVPLLRGMVHLDVKRFQREMKFWPSMIVEFVPQATTCLLAYPMVTIFNDFTAVLYLILIQTLIYLLLTHFVAAKPYNIAVDSKYIISLGRFGWPLLLNGLILFGVFQGDKFVVGRFYSMYDMAIYSAAFMMVMMPATIMATTTSSILLPLFSKSNDIEIRKTYIRSGLIAAVFAGCMVVFFDGLGGWVLEVVFGQKYNVGSDIIYVISIMWALRILRVMPVILAMARSDTMLSLYSNILRSFALVAVYYAASLGYPLTAIAWTGVFGEVAALLLMLILVHVVYKISIINFIPNTLVFITLVLSGYKLLDIFQCLN